MKKILALILIVTLSSCETITIKDVNELLSKQKQIDSLYWSTRLIQQQNNCIIQQIKQVKETNQFLDSLSKGLYR